MEVYITFIESLGYILDLLSVTEPSSPVADRIYLLPLESELWLSPLIQISTQLCEIPEVGWPGMPSLTLIVHIDQTNPDWFCAG